MVLRTQLSIPLISYLSTKSESSLPGAVADLGAKHSRRPRLERREHVQLENSPPDIVRGPVGVLSGVALVGALGSDGRNCSVAEAKACLLAARKVPPMP